MIKILKKKIDFFTIAEKILNEFYVVCLTKLTIFDQLTPKFDQKHHFLINNDNFSLEFQLLFKYLRSEVKLKVLNSYYLTFNQSFTNTFFYYLLIFKN